MKPRMGRKKSNARILPRGRKIHVNKYINKRGCTKHKSAATHNHSTEKQQESSHTTYDSFPAYNWPTTRMRSGLQNLVTIMAPVCRVGTVRC